MYKLLYICLVPFLFLTPYLCAQNIRIGLFNELPLKTVVVSVPANNYQVVCDSFVVLKPVINDAYYVTLGSGKLILRDKNKAVGLFSHIKFIPLNSNTYTSVTPVLPRANTRFYSGLLDISIAYSRILIVNELNVNNYIAGVVEAEAGTNAGIEFYKAQSVLARTYLFGHFEKHTSEGFNLCDDVHCQAYNGLASKNQLIREATSATNGLVAKINDTTYVTAAFHANCGGYTESAHNAWLNKKDYLIPVKDPFCQNSPSARWEKILSMDTWRQYLKNHGFKNSVRLPYIEFSIVNTTREQYYIVKRDSIPYKQIRNDFQLKSSFFSISATEKEIIFKGRGYGHGVGLCQEGAMQMAKIGYNFEEILKYYFKGIELVKR